MDLIVEHEAASSEEAPLLKTKKPFPLLQLSIIWFIQFCEPITNTVIYPFINPFVAETGITRGDETRTGYYAGIIESSFFFAETLCCYHWGRLSDRIGRRPVLLLAPLGLACSILVFGLSRSFWLLVASRCAQGVFNGNIGVGKTVMIEITDPADVPRAFGAIPALWSVGITLGPIIGGALARPAVRWPDTFEKFAFFHDYPYFLPCAVMGSVALGSFLFTCAFMEESLQSISKHDTKQKRRESPAHASDIESNLDLLSSTAHRDSEYGPFEPVTHEENVDSPSIYGIDCLSRSELWSATSTNAVNVDTIGRTGL
ncbi:hypothetical protein H0H92_008834 [Tricholoma furcatifolium]|nr:hypothetical protein H0H92_008834 [Tricholoma furcatifolium]